MTAELSTEIDKPCHLRICGLSDETKGCSAKAGQPCQHAPADNLIERVEAMTASDASHFYTVDALDLMRELTAALRQVTAERDEWQAACSTVSASLAIKATGAEARAETAEDQLKTVLDREAATTARYDAKMETAEAKVASLTEAATLAMADLEMAFKPNMPVVELIRLGTGACLRLRVALNGETTDE